MSANGSSRALDSRRPSTASSMRLRHARRRARSTRPSARGRTSPPTSGAGHARHRSVARRLPATRRSPRPPRSRRWRSASRARRPASRSTFRALRSFDASLSLYTSAMSVASLQINYADFDATLTQRPADDLQAHRPVLWRRRRFLRHRRCLGQTAGGRREGRRAAASMSARCCAARRAPTTSAIDNLTVAIDGKLDATGIQLTGKGQSPRGYPRWPRPATRRLSGYVYPNVVKGSQSLRPVRHRRRQHLQRRHGLQLFDAAGLHQPPEHARRASCSSMAAR